MDHHTKEYLIRIKLIFQMVELVCRSILKLNENVYLVAHTLYNTCDPRFV